MRSALLPIVIYSFYSLHIAHESCRLFVHVFYLLYRYYWLSFSSSTEEIRLFCIAECYKSTGYDTYILPLLTILCYFIRANHFPSACESRVGVLAIFGLRCGQHKWNSVYISFHSMRTICVSDAPISVGHFEHVFNRPILRHEYWIVRNRRNRCSINRLEEESLLSCFVFDANMQSADALLLGTNGLDTYLCDS